MPDSPAPLVERFDTITSDSGEIEALVEAMFGTPGRVERSDGRPPSLRLTQAGVEGFGVQRITWHADGRCGAGPLDRFVSIRMRAGSYGLDQGDGEARHRAGDAFLVDPHRPVDAELIAADLECLTLDRREMERIAAQIAPWSRGHLDFRKAASVTPALARVWNAALDGAERVFALDDLVGENALVRASLMYQVVAAACASFALLPDRRGSRPASSRTVQRAVGFIDDNLAQPITTGDVAAAVGVSVRTLQVAFRRDLDTTPAAHLRRARLAATRRDLQAAPPGETVARIARGWGFAHLGRYAIDYRAEFGESPRETLKRG